MWSCIAGQPLPFDKRSSSVVEAVLMKRTSQSLVRSSWLLVVRGSGWKRCQVCQLLLHLPPTLWASVWPCQVRICTKLPHFCWQSSCPQGRKCNLMPPDGRELWESLPLAIHGRAEVGFLKHVVNGVEDLVELSTTFLTENDPILSYLPTIYQSQC